MRNAEDSVFQHCAAAFCCASVPLNLAGGPKHATWLAAGPRGGPGMKHGVGLFCCIQEEKVLWTPDEPAQNSLQQRRPSPTFDETTADHDDPRGSR